MTLNNFTLKNITTKIKICNCTIQIHVCVGKMINLNFPGHREKVTKALCLAGKYVVRKRHY